jgi:apolipoprotein N-acyltransferase
MVVLDPEHTVMGAFHKRHLVPFGEAVPWPFDSFFKRLVPGLGMFKPGPVADPIPVHGARLAGLICYEGIFPQYSRRFVRAGANLLINVTNDAWYGYSSAPHQHVGYYALRAVENGRSVVRAANAGVSALYGPDGRPRGATRLFEDAVLVAPAPLLEIRTLYQLVGDAPAWFCLVLLLGLVGVRLVRREVDPCAAPDQAR